MLPSHFDQTLLLPFASFLNFLFSETTLLLRLILPRIASKPFFMGFCLSRGKTHNPVHCTIIDLMKVPNEGPLICLVPASTDFVFDVVLVIYRFIHSDETISFMMYNYYKI